MARTDTLGNFLTDVADAIRTAEGSSEEITASDFDERIEALSGGGGADLSEYFLSSASYFGGSNDNLFQRIVRKVPDGLFIPGQTLAYAFKGCVGLESAPTISTTYITNMIYMFRSCTNLKSVPQYDTQRVTNVTSMFEGCYRLEDFPALNLRSCTSFTSFLRGCQSLTNESLNNVLATCISATSFTGEKTLKYLFGSQDMSSYYSASTIQGLSNYQDFIDAGWTIGW